MYSIEPGLVPLLWNSRERRLHHGGHVLCVCCRLFGSHDSAHDASSNTHASAYHASAYDSAHASAYDSAHDSAHDASSNTHASAYDRVYDHVPGDRTRGPGIRVNESEC